MGETSLSNNYTWTWPVAAMRDLVPRMMSADYTVAGSTTKARIENFKSDDLPFEDGNGENVLFASNSHGVKQDYLLGNGLSVVAEGGSVQGVWVADRTLCPWEDGSCLDATHKKSSPHSRIVYIDVYTQDATTVLVSQVNNSKGMCGTPHRGLKCCVRNGHKMGCPASQPRESKLFLDVAAVASGAGNTQLFVVQTNSSSFFNFKALDCMYPGCCPREQALVGNFRTAAKSVMKEYCDNNTRWKKWFSKPNHYSKGRPYWKNSTMPDGPGTYHIWLSENVRCMDCVRFELFFQQVHRGSGARNDFAVSNANITVDLGRSCVLPSVAADKENVFAVTSESISMYTHHGTRKFTLSEKRLHYITGNAYLGGEKNHCRKNGMHQFGHGAGGYLQRGRGGGQVTLQIAQNGIAKYAYFSTVQGYLLRFDVAAQVLKVHPACMLRSVRD